MEVHSVLKLNPFRCLHYTIPQIHSCPKCRRCQRDLPCGQKRRKNIAKLKAVEEERTHFSSLNYPIPLHLFQSLLLTAESLVILLSSDSAQAAPHWPSKACQLHKAICSHSIQQHFSIRKATTFYYCALQLSFLSAAQRSNDTANVQSNTHPREP